MTTPDPQSPDSVREAILTVLRVVYLNTARPRPSDYADALAPLITRLLFDAEIRGGMDMLQLLDRPDADLLRERLAAGPRTPVPPITLTPEDLSMCDTSSLAAAWSRGYDAGDRDAYNAAEARQWNGRDLDPDELTANPYQDDAPTTPGDPA